MFLIIKNYKSQINITNCLEILLALPKVLFYIDWQEKNPQMMIVLKISVRQMFPLEAQAYIEQLEESEAVNKMKLQDLDKIHRKLNKSEMVDDD